MTSINIIQPSISDIDRLAFIYHESLKDNPIYSSLYKSKAKESQIIALIALELSILMKSANFHIQCATIDDNIIAFTSRWNPQAFYKYFSNIKLKLKYSRQRRLIMNEDQLKQYNKVTALPGNRSAVYHLAVLPEYQRQGTGKRLLESVIRKQKQINVATNEHAKHVYLKVGFKVEDIRMIQLNHEKLPIYIMRYRKNT